MVDRSFVYSPSIEIHMQTADGTIYDVSDDISTASVQRIVNGVSTVSFTLSNAARKYDNLFTEMDKVAVYLSRIKRLLVFTGYLDLVPVFSTNAMSVQLQASCTLKRLQNWYWDPSTSAAQTLLYPASSTKWSSLTDGGLAQRTIDLLTEVCGWPTAQIHIGAVPRDWFTAIAGVANRIVAEATEQSMIAEVGGSGYVNGKTAIQQGLQQITGVGPGTGTLPSWSGALSLYNRVDDQLDSKATKPSGAYYITMPWPYLAPDPSTNLSGGTAPLVGAPGVNVAKARAWWMGRNILIVNSKNGKAVCCKAVGWGPNVIGATQNRTIGSTSQQVLGDLGVTKGSALSVGIAFAPAGMKVGKQATGTVDVAQAQGLAAESKSPAGITTSGSTAVQMADTAAAWVTSSGVDYKWGGGHPPNLSDPHPTGMDCSGTVNWAMGRIGKSPHDNTAAGWASYVKKISLADAKKTKGALVFLGGPGTAHHVGISMGDGTTAEARTQGEVSTYPFSGAHSNAWTYAGTIPTLDYTGAKLSGTGGTPGKFGAGNKGGTGTDSTTGNLDGDIGTSLYNVWQWVGSHDFGGELLAGDRALMNDEPVMNTVNMLMTTGLRQYCSAPNGDFIGWFPDYFGWYGTAGKMIIQPIEILEDFAVARSDSTMKTHWFTTSSPVGVEGAGDATSIAQEYSTAGIASVEMPDLMKALFRYTTEFDDKGESFLARYGARPNFEPMDNISGHRQEFFFAVTRFALNWATRWSAPVNVTFMPELFPGMLAVFPSFGIQCYVQQVTHTVNQRANGGFTTTFTGIAWSAIGNKSTLKGLVKGAPVS